MDFDQSPVGQTAQPSNQPITPQPNITRIIVLCVIFSLAAGFIGGSLASGQLFGQSPAAITQLLNGQSVVTQNSNNGQTIAMPQEQAVEKVVSDVSPAVVSVIATKNISVNQQSVSPFDQFFGNFFPNFGFQSPSSGSGATQPQEVGGGSGFIISSDGMILTNKHVVDIQGVDYAVLTNDGQKYPAKILAEDPVQDIAIIKIDKIGLPVVKIGSSDKIKIGQTAIAIGNALGEFRNTVSVGVISGLSRSVVASSGFGSQAEQLDNVIQTDAAINPGNSGGPLLNLSGEVVGINVAVAQGAQNVGFALPINLAARDISQVVKQGKITYPFLGVRYVLVTPAVKQQYNLSVDYGALIIKGQNPGETAVTSGSPAEKAGIQENDIILAVDGQKITSDNALAKMIQNYNVGDTISLKILSKGQEKTVRVILSER